MKRRLFYLFVLVALALFSGSDTPWAQARPLDVPHTDMHQGGGFTTASLQGAYAVVGGTAMAGVVGICHMDGNGHFDCTLTTNVPGEEEEERTVYASSSEGEYSVNLNGTGTVHEVETMPDGTIAEFDHDFVITAAEAIGPYVVATEVRSLIRQAFDPSGAVITTQLTRLPDVGTAPAMPAPVAAERLMFSYVAVNRLDAVEGHQLGMQGHGTFDPQNVEDIEGSGHFFQFDNAAEGVPKPLVGLGAGTWRVVRGVSFTPLEETYGPLTPGVLEVVVELMPEEGEAVEATLRVICNAGPGGLINMENGEALPEGYVLTVAEMGTFEPIISAEPGVPPFGLTWIGPPN